MQIPDGYRAMEATDLERSILLACSSMLSVGFLFRRAGHTQGPLGIATGLQCQMMTLETVENVSLTLAGLDCERLQRQLADSLAPFMSVAYMGKPSELYRDLARVRDAVDLIHGKSSAQSAADSFLKRNGGG